MTYLLQHEVLVLNGTYLFFFLLFGIWEFLKPGFPVKTPRLSRWPSNLSLLVVNRLTLQIFSTTFLTNQAYMCWKNGWGLLNYLQINPWVSLILSFILLDLVAFFQHRAFHKFPYLWRVHRLHHDDPVVDVTTSARFHPFEPLISTGVSIAVIYLLGPSFVIVFLIDALGFLYSYFIHGNLYLPPALDRALRLVVNTPAMHHIHHSRHIEETDSNYSNILTCWDRLGGTYKEKPKRPYEQMELGLKEFDRPEDLQLPRMLLNPFLKAGN
jgi:sterol desaturase/sphingolipid hydroxylase (fatty acid hydroxylase superfamily)